MSASSRYTPPKILTRDRESDDRFADINRPTMDRRRGRICRSATVPFSFIHKTRRTVRR
jgi:hypothetical protein